jgi:dihydrofolate synthase / folylpolyglutamate synthase
MLFDFPKYGDGICLARMARLLDRLAIDRNRLARGSVVVTGSNGKGSTAALCAGIAQACGLRTGLFTSPHLFRVNERFQIDGAPIDDGDLNRLALRIKTAIADISGHGGERFGAFEAMFALACLYFQQRDCEFAVFEAGIGGRYDPVRLIGATVTCVTSVDFEHVELLGHSLQSIVSDKSDACACGGSIIYGENCRNLRPHILEHNRNRNVASLFVGDEMAIGEEAVSLPYQRFDFGFGEYQFRSLDLALLGRFQINNAAIAIACFLLWLDAAGRRPDFAAIETAVRSGLRATRWPGRLEVIGREPLTVIDVGHTPDGVRQSLAGLKAAYGTQGWILVLGVSLDKKTGEIAEALAPSFDIIICTRAHHKGGDASALAAVVRNSNPRANVEIAATIEQAFGASRTLAASLGRKIYVAGGLFTAVEFAATARGMRADDLEFF